VFLDDVEVGDDALIGTAGNAFGRCLQA